MKLKYIIPIFIIAALLLLPACELQRPGDDSGDITLTTPEPPPVEATTPPGPATEEPAGPEPADISPEGVPAAQAPGPQAAEPGKVLLKLTQQADMQARSYGVEEDDVTTSGISTLDQALAQIGASDLEPLTVQVGKAADKQLEAQAVGGLSQLYTVTFGPEQDPVAVAQTLAQDPAVEFAEPNYIASIAAEPVVGPASLQPNDPYFKYQWNLQKIQMPAAWDINAGQGVIVAVVDTGVDFSASDMAAATCPATISITMTPTPPTTRVTAPTWPGPSPRAPTMAQAWPVSPTRPPCCRSKQWGPTAKAATKTSSKALFTPWTRAPRSST